MASELEPEAPAIDRSLLECSAEETAGVSAGTPAGTSVPCRPSPVGGTGSWKPRSGPALTWGVTRALGSPASPAGERPGDATDPSILPPLSSRSPRICSVPQPPFRSLSAQENQQLFRDVSFPPHSYEVPNTRAFALYARSWNRGGKDTSWCFGYNRPP